ncbi:hypothetical protein Avbf_07374 [Armadillidium vulgare]|nr:hypothetical protein Avbf_07374 [Armadillidium vulgare]
MACHHALFLSYAPFSFQKIQALITYSFHFFALPNPIRIGLWLQECINPREKVMPSKNLEEKGLEIEIGSELEMFYKKISESSYPKIVLTKLSEEELKDSPHILIYY